MSLLPFDKFSIQSDMTYDELRKRLAENLAPLNSYYLNSGFKFNFIRMFEGEINGDTFRIKRMIKYRNSFIPVIKGKFSNLRQGGGQIEMKMRMHGFVLVFMIIWFIGALIACLAYLIPGLKQGRFDPTSLFGIFMILFGYGLMMISFNLENDKAKKELKKIFNDNKK